MTAPEQPTWHVADDPYGESTLFHGDTSVFRESDFAVAGAEYRDQLWSVLTAVLATPRDVLLHLAEVIHEHDISDTGLPEARAVLAALAGTAAPHERDEEVGECTCVSYVVDHSHPEPRHPENVDTELTPGCPRHDPNGVADA